MVKLYYATKTWVPGWAEFTATVSGRDDLKDCLVIDCPNVFTLWLFLENGTYYVWASTSRRGHHILGCSVFPDLIELKTAAYIEEHIPEQEGSA